MRIWDIPAGYLNRESLLGEHAELHALLSILRGGRRGFARHPETLRWIGCESGLARRHALQAAEMRLRGYVDRTPVEERAREPVWPKAYVDPPARQFELLGRKYEGKGGGRIPLPQNASELWAQHKYSVLARDPETYRALGRRVASAPGRDEMAGLAADLVELLRRGPPAGPLRDAIDHMWGHVGKAASFEEREEAQRDPAARLGVVQRLSLRTGEAYLTGSTALSELAVFAAR